MVMAKLLSLGVVWVAASLAAVAQDAGPAKADVQGDAYSLRNGVVAARWSVVGKRVSGLTVQDRLDGKTLAVPVPFALLMKSGAMLDLRDMAEVGEARFAALTGDAGASRYAERLAGEAFEVRLADAGSGLRVVWRLVLRDGSRYLRQTVTLTAGDKDVAIGRVRMLDVKLPGAQVVGSVKGSPVVGGDFFLGFEDPLSDSKVREGMAVATVDRELPLRAGQTVTYSSVIGVVRDGQLRRDFLEYIERERAHPYRTFLHYNSWYDIGYFTPYAQAEALDRIDAFGRELHEKRGVVLDSYLFDDGWDDRAGMWSFSKGFPDGFTPLKEAAAKYGAAPGVWLSPWGGYGPPKKERIAAGKAAGYEEVEGGFALSGPKYYERFREVCLEMVRKYGINQFKFDGTGNADSVFPGSRFDSDFAAALALIGDLRKAKPDLYINLTTGTYPSPFWLMDADSIWRGGEDDSVAGVGPYRERWITYRDADTYEEVVKAGPLYPLNSLMLHGMIYAQHQKQLSVDPGGDFRNEVRSYFGTGTQLQEMYLTPGLLSEANWDDLAEAAKWSRANADVLKDTHWVGGDPAWLEVYGWASWSRRKGILVLRNPSDKPQKMAIDVGRAFELPADAARRYVARSPWASDAALSPVELVAGTEHVFQLAPFEVLTLEMTPSADK
jgi:hypothetical protein